MNDRYIVSHSVLALAAIAALPGCMQSRVDESRELHTQIEKSEAVVILPKPRLEGAAAEEGFMDCVGGGLAGHGDSAIAVRGHQDFVDSTFPWFEPGTAPSRPEAIEQLLTRPGLAEKVAASHVRYIVWLDGGTRKTDGGGSIACGAAPGAAGCIGFGWWEKETNYEATITVTDSTGRVWINARRYQSPPDTGAYKVPPAIAWPGSCARSLPARTTPSPSPPTSTDRRPRSER